MTRTLPTITSLEAQSTVNLFLSEHLTDRFMAGQPRFDEESHIWLVPVLLAYAVIGAVGQVGEVKVKATSAEVITYTSFTDMKAAAQTLYEQYRDEIEAPVS